MEILTPVTVLQAGPCVVTQVKTEENDGYSAVQVGFVDKKEKGINKPQKGHFDKAGVAPKRFVREFRFENAEEYTVGQEIKADIFAAGDKIDATATSKGKGYAGGIKRHGLKSGPSAHGSNIIVMQVLMVWLLILAKYSKERNARTNGSRKSYYSES